ncbi:hypothetical protein QN219_31415 [Sinorhizobium sp. 7-81]|nr:hypothetical protein [Sinorhizobium sp. 7-81]MDK1389925.1 hypothetical protein [Sinorhizobium sp. 7-81]MDK1494456.1 hypothetical protein [Sinorhizobium sp. 8-89]
MKTPWKLLVQLTSSRRQPAKVQENSNGHDTEPEALESESQHASALPSADTAQASSTPDHDAGVPVDQASVPFEETKGQPDVVQATSLPFDIEKAQTPAPGEAQRSGVADELVSKGETSTKSQRKPPIKRREPAKRGRARLVAQGAAATNEAQSVHSSSEDTFFNDVKILDEEIKELRRLLAPKLHRQNLQLKKMLERFDVS